MTPAQQARVREILAAIHLWLEDPIPRLDRNRVIELCEEGPLDHRPQRRRRHGMTMTDQPQPTTGMWAPFQRAENAQVLEEAGQFVLVGVTVREAIPTEYGLRDAADLTVATTQPGEVRLFSTFAAGIVGQAKRVQDGDLPAVCAISPQETPKGATKALALIAQLPAGADPFEVAKVQPTPIGPTQKTDTNGSIPY